MKTALADEHVKVQDNVFSNDDNLELIADNIELVKGEKILNIGCGCGRLAAKLMNKGYDVELVTDRWKESFVKYDVIIATHFHSFSDIKHMCRLTKRKVYIISPTEINVNSLAQHRHKEGAIYDNMSDIFNMLYMYGISPNVNVLKTKNGDAISVIYWDVVQETAPCHSERSEESLPPIGCKDSSLRSSG